MNIILEIKAPELVRAVEMLAASLSGAVNKPDFQQILQDFSQQAPAPQQQVQQVTQAVPTTTTIQPPLQQHYPPLQQQPVQQVAQQMPQAVPTSAPTYTTDQLAVAATQLMDAGRQQEVMQLLASFGVQMLVQLPKEQYGAFATKLRELGAQI